MKLAVCQDALQIKVTLVSGLPCHKKNDETEPGLQSMYPLEIVGERLMIVDVVQTMTRGLNRIYEVAA